MLPEVESFTINQLIPALTKGYTLSDAEKKQIAWRAGNGYVPPGGLNPSADKAADLKERLYFAREYAASDAEQGRYPAAPSQWPDERNLPGFRAFLIRIDAK